MTGTVEQIALEQKRLDRLRSQFDEATRERYNRLMAKPAEKPAAKNLRPCC